MLKYKPGKGPDGESPYDSEHPIEEPYNPQTKSQKKRMERALQQEEFAVDACWACGFPLLPIDMIDAFRFQRGYAWCSKCVPRSVLRSRKKA